MKQGLFNKALLLTGLYLLSAFGAYAERYEEKEKVINKSFDVKSTVELAIENKHGEVHVNTWDKNQITIKVTVKAVKRTADRAQELLDQIRIDIDDRRSSNLISVETKIDGNINNRGGEGFEINYEVNMPKNNPLDLKNKHGATYLDDFNGPLKVRVAHGKFRGGAITSTDARIDNAFGGTELKSFAGGSIEIQHGSLEVETIGSVKMDIAHSNVEIDQAKSIELDLSHSRMTLEEVDDLEGSLAHSSLNLDKLNKSLVADTQHAGRFVVGKVDANFQKIDLDGQFTTFDLTLDRGVSCKFDAKFSFGDVRYLGSEIDMKYRNIDKHSAEYRTVIGSNQSPTSSIRVRGQHGDLKIRLN